jgi:hypothetical protein
MSARATSLVHAPLIAAENAAAKRFELAKNELLGFPALHLPRLPLHVRISVQALGFAHPIMLHSGVRAAPEQRACSAIAFDGEELAAVALAVQAERMWPADFKGFCLHKLHDASFRLGAQLALAGAQPSEGPPWSLGRVLRWLDLELIEFTFVDDAGPVHPMRPDVAAA